MDQSNWPWTFTVSCCKRMNQDEPDCQAIESRTPAGRGSLKLHASDSQECRRTSSRRFRQLRRRKFARLTDLTVNEKSVGVCITDAQILIACRGPLTSSSSSRTQDITFKKRLLTRCRDSTNTTTSSPLAPSSLLSTRTTSVLTMLQSE